jgi:biotin transport system substrate-specific component
MDKIFLFFVTTLVSRCEIMLLENVFVGLLILSVLSQFSIPLKPVPITLQSLAVLIVALIYDVNSGILACLIYLLIGALGIPVYNGGTSGIDKIFGPTGGYLFGFLFCIYFMHCFKFSLMNGNNDNIYLLFMNCLFGTLIILIIGTIRLANFLTLKNALKNGFLPFIFPGILKSIAAVFIVYLLKNFLKFD